jgi:predicted nucleotidyltransferase
VTKERKLLIFSWIKDAVNEFFPNQNYKLFVFGSQANREILSSSDIDVGIDIGKPIENRIISMIWNKLDDLPTLYTFDVIDFQMVEDRFKKVALKNIEVLHDGF